MKLKLFNQKIRMLGALLFMSCIFTVASQAQTSVSGTVISADDNMPLAGATVIEKGTRNGTSTDFDGKFTFDIASINSLLVVSYVGFKTQEVKASTDPITIVLQTDASALDEVVVVGYGTQRKSDIVNSVATVDLEEATLSPTSDVNEMLRGRIAGLQV
ncbi:carboxypeptidase-like regulatory domain-containing protein, partial [Gelidibacter japonicus]